MAIIRTHIRPGVHPRRWKVARGVNIPKPGKDDYGLAKSYRVISLLNFLGKMVEKVAVMMVSAYCEATGRFRAAFPSVARGCLLRKMRAMGIDENLMA